MESILAGHEYLVALGLAIISTMVLPAAIWDSQSGRYHGYYNRRALTIIIFVVIAGGSLSIGHGMSGPDVVNNIGVYLAIVIFVSRLYVEFSHYHKYKFWLHRQYHKLTDHEDPREASP